MIILKCDKCGTGLVLDEQLSSEHIWTKENIKYDKTGQIIEDTLTSELVYRCVNCEQVFNLTYKEWEEKVRKQLASEVMRLKRMIAMREIDPYEVDPDNGLLFCGLCPGYDDSGNCFKSIVAKCKLKRDKEV